jgi:hypothetical protein
MGGEDAANCSTTDYADFHSLFAPGSALIKKADSSRKSRARNDSSMDCADWSLMSAV